MNFDYKINSAINSAEAALNNANRLKSEYESAKEFTQTFLNTCGDAGIDAVCIGVRNEIVKSSMDWPFGPDDSVFAMGRDKFGSPAIWGVVNKLGINAGCGNTDQYQTDTSNLIDGAYQLKDGKWIKVDDVSTCSA